MSDLQEVAGTVWAVFGHRLAIEGTGGRFLADLGPKGAEGVEIRPGDAIALKGMRKPTEIKVASLTLGDGATHEITWPKKPEHGEVPHDPSAAVAAVEAEGYAVEGEPRRKPKHFEIVGSKGGARHAFHVAFDGTIRKTRRVAA